MTAFAWAEVTYDVLPLPRSIELNPKGGEYVLTEGAVVTYPASNAQMASNAQLLAKYLKEDAGFGLKVQPDVKKGAAITLCLGLKNDCPDAYLLKVDKKGITIQGATEEGIFRGLMTLRKAIGTEGGEKILLPFVTIQDEPRFAYRGVHFDTARHFFSVDFIKEFLDIMALHGCNQFHWHLTEDQGWRFEVKSMPEHLPGHMLGALHVYPELGCTGGPYEVWPIWGVSEDVLCAGNPKTLEFLKQVYGELCDVFPSKLIHIGGDESPRVRWKNCPKCQAKMKELGLTREAELQTYINKEMDKFLTAKGRTIIGWDETLEGGLSENGIVMSWRGMKGGIAAARQHHRVIMTPTDYCYIDYYQLKDDWAQPHGIGGYLPVSKVYSMEPVPAELSKEEGKFIMGAQVNLWTEYVGYPDHAMYMLLPRLDAISEVQWMQPEQKDFEAFKVRLARMEKLYDKLNYKYCHKIE